MPRVVSNHFRDRDAHLTAAAPQQSPIKIPLNDDRQEKANRLQSRQAQHEVQMSHIRSAATPLRKRKSLAGGMDGSPHTPQHGDDGGFRVTGTAVTPMKRMPIMANFEEWMKMATDNKINAQNSWNFALIDYFHDMSLLKEGDSVNFQRASCTLDGCVKIYTSRVDSVATETGKLLSGLAENRDKKKKGGEDDVEAGEDAEEDEEGEEGVKKKRKKTKTSEATLVNSFAQLQLKKMELEFAVDPLFKKASADFDEGGAKGLLLNHLAIDGNGRIVFDSSDDAQEVTGLSEQEGIDTEDADASMVSERQASEDHAPVVDIAALGRKFFPDLAVLDEQDICPSLKDFDLSDATASLNLPFLKPPEDWKNDLDRRRSGAVFDGDMAPDFDDDDGDLEFDIPEDAGFGEGGDAWAREAAIEPQHRLHTNAVLNGEDGEIDENGEVGDFEPSNPHYGVRLVHSKEDEQENILNFFDQALQKNWAGPEHWKIRKFKENAKVATALPAKRKEKEPFEIDFASTMSQAIADALYVPATSTSTISLPKNQWRSRTRNLLPDDKHFNSRQLLRLFLKPKARMGSKRTAHASIEPRNENEGIRDGDVDEAYWAQQNGQVGAPEAEDQLPQGDYDADFFQDDGLGAGGGMEDDSDVFADARESFSPPLEGDDAIPKTSMDAVLNGNLNGAFGTQLVTESRRLRPEYVQYARVAKKVDVRRLKEEMWKGIGYEPELLPPQTPSRLPAMPLAKGPDDALKFTEVMKNLQSVYPQQAMSDISTSYCFICLLHLANEKGLTIDNHEGFQELTIRKDHTAEVEASGA